MTKNQPEMSGFGCAIGLFVIVFVAGVISWISGLIPAWIFCGGVANLFVLAGAALEYTTELSKIPLQESAKRDCKIFAAIIITVGLLLELSFFFHEVREASFFNVRVADDEVQIEDEKARIAEGMAQIESDKLIVAEDEVLVANANETEEKEKLELEKLEEKVTPRTTADTDKFLAKLKSIGPRQIDIMVLDPSDEASKLGIELAIDFEKEGWDVATWKITPQSFGLFPRGVAVATLDESDDDTKAKAADLRTELYDQGIAVFLTGKWTTFSGKTPSFGDNEFEVTNMLGPDHPTWHGNKEAAIRVIITAKPAG